MASKDYSVTSFRTFVERLRDYFEPKIQSVTEQYSPNLLSLIQQYQNPLQKPVEGFLNERVYSPEGQLFPQSLTRLPSEEQNRLYGELFQNAIMGATSSPIGKGIGVALKPTQAGKGVTLQPINKITSIYDKTAKANPEKGLTLSGIFKDGKQVGYVEFQAVPNVGMYVDKIEVYPEYQRQGIATEALNIIKKQNNIPANKPVEIFRAANEGSAKFWEEYNSPTQIGKK